MHFFNFIGYLWDVSDWASPDQSVNNNFIDESPTEGQDSSSVQSTDSNSFVSQIEMLPDRSGSKEEMHDQHIPSPSKCKESSPKLKNTKCNTEESPNSKLLKKHSPPHTSYENRSLKWAEGSEDEGFTYGFPKAGGRGFRKALESGDYGVVNRDADNFYLDGIDSDNASVSDASVKVCEIEDSETDICDVETLPPPKNYASVPSFV